MKNKSKRMIKQFLKVALGITLIVLGIVGWLVPFVPGTLMIIGGLILLGYTAKDIKKIRLRKILNRLKKHSP